MISWLARFADNSEFRLRSARRVPPANEADSLGSACLMLHLAQAPMRVELRFIMDTAPQFAQPYGHSLVLFDPKNKRRTRGVQDPTLDRSPPLGSAVGATVLPFQYARNVAILPVSDPDDSDRIEN